MRTTTTLLFTALLAGLASSCQPFVHAQFTYELPKFHARLGGANFEYVMFGVVGEANIAAKIEQMPSTMEIGLVNEALQKIYQSAPLNEPFALVNVVVDVSRETMIVAGFGAVTETNIDDYLVIRADIVRFTEKLAEPLPAPAPEPAPPAAEDKGAQRPGGGVQQLAAALASLRAERGTDDAQYRRGLVELAHAMIAEQARRTL